jgi:ATP-binding cassette subfamily F protein 3
MLNLSNLSVHFGQRTLFESLDLFVGKRERVGLVGRNGAGKSTLLRIIAGENKPTTGNITMPNGAQIGYLAQEMVHNEEATIIDEASSAFEEAKDLESQVEQLSKQLSERDDYESKEYAQIIEDLTNANERIDLIGGASLEEQVQRILQGLGFSAQDMNRTMSEFSGGWKMRVELAKLLLRNPDLLLLDEPTNHLDLESIDWLETFLLQSSSAIVLISHDRAFLDNLTSRTVEITPVKLYDFKASYTAYQTWREEDRERQMQAVKNQQKYIEETEILINKFRAKKNKAAFAQSLIKKLDKLERLEVDAADKQDIRFRFPKAPRSGKVSIESSNLSKSFGELSVFKNLDFLLARNEKVALVGKNGAGKTTLTRIFMGLESAKGEMNIGHNVDIGYYAQNQAEELDGNLTVFETLDDVAVGDIRSQLRSILGSFLFSGEDAEKKVKVLSGGEKARLALCKLLLHPYNLLILDEPTNHLDIRAKGVLKEALRSYDGTLIVVSHDRDFLSDLTELVYEVTPTGLRQYIGDIKQFLHEKHAASIRAYEAGKAQNIHISKEKAETPKDIKSGETPEKKPPKLSYAERKDRDKLERKLRNQLKKQEGIIQNKEVEIKALDEEIASIDPNNRQKLTDLAYRYETVQTELNQAMELWTETGVLLEKFK